MDRALRARTPHPPDPSPGLHATAQAQQFKLIEHSHQRCEALGLSRIERPDPAPLMRSDIAVARERNQRLFAHAAPVMEMLFQQIAGTESMIVLTDAQGTILHSVGDDDFLDRAGKVALKPGVSWAEHSKGTNAIGTALFEEAPTLVHAGQHYMHANNFLTCSAAPIFDPRGSMLGVLDVSGDQRSYHQHTMGLVRVSARMIENHWLSDDCSHRLRLHFHSRAEFIGTLLEGILVISPEGKIVGSNRSALDQLALAAATLRTHTLTSLLGIGLSAVMDHLRAPRHVPLLLNLPNGQPLYVMARFNPMPRPAAAARRVAMPEPTEARAEAPPASAPDTALRAPSAVTTAETPADRGAAPAADPAPKRPAPGGGLQALQTGDARIDTLVGKLRRVIDRGIPMLIVGETGTGKEQLARAIHCDSARAEGPFVVVHCAAVPERLLEATLFAGLDLSLEGDGRNASPGSFMQARGGTLLLDEIGDLPPALQARLLGVLQECGQGAPTRGDGRALDVAVMVATHRHLRELVARQQFREDLYHRLNGLSLPLPALRERSDLAALAQRILHSECPRGTPQLSAPVMALLHAADWPGNIRQLANVLRIAVAMAAGEALITEAHLPDDFLDDVRRAPPAATCRASQATSAPDPTPTMKDAERETIRAAVAAAGGNISVASRRLGICRNTIYRKLYWGENK